jgi:hypothetical protein
MPALTLRTLDPMPVLSPFWSRVARFRRCAAWRTPHPGARERGQGLVEFSLVFPLFILLFVGTVEFSMLMNATQDINYASRNAALLAAEAGNTVGADCVILQSIESDMTLPSRGGRILSVEIYWSDADGDIKSGEVTFYNRSGSTSCTYRDGTTITVPYSATFSGYPEAERCNIIKGCNAQHTELDTVGIRITYRHVFVTPLRQIMGGLGQMTFARATAMRMEPVL